MSLVDLQAEREMLCVMLGYATVLDSHPLPADAWTTITHESIAAAIRWLYDGGVKPTAPHVVTRLTQTDRLASVGGDIAVYEIEAAGSGLPTEADRLHARLSMLARLRRQKAHLKRALAAVERLDSDEATVYASAALERDDAGGGESFTLGEAVLGSYARLTGPAGAKSATLPTCIAAVDYELVGSGRGDLVIVGARSNVGKTSFALSTAENLLAKGRRAGVILLEDPRHLIEDRLMSRHSGVPSRALRARDLTASQHEDVAEVAGVMSQLRRDQGYVVTCLPGATDAEVVREMSRLARVERCDLVVIDYMQAVRCSTREQDRRTSIHASAARIKAAAMRLQVVAMLMSQLTTETGDELSEPRMEDLRDCKDLVSIGDTIMVLWRKEKTSTAIVYGKVEKTKAEGLGARFAFTRGPGGSLVECDVPEESSGYSPRSGGYQRGRA